MTTEVVSETACLLSFVSTGKARLPERNAAGEKPATQSSTYYDQYAWKAVDGNAVPGPGKVACPRNDLHSWWAVDLFNRLLIQEVIVTTDMNVGKGKFKILFIPRKVGHLNST